MKKPNQLQDNYAHGLSKEDKGGKRAPKSQPNPSRSSVECKRPNASRLGAGQSSPRRLADKTPSTPGATREEAKTEIVELLQLNDLFPRCEFENLPDWEDSPWWSHSCVPFKHQDLTNGDVKLCIVHQDQVIRVRVEKELNSRLNRVAEARGCDAEEVTREALTSKDRRRHFYLVAHIDTPGFISAAEFFRCTPQEAHEISGTPRWSEYEKIPQLEQLPRRFYVAEISARDAFEVLSMAHLPRVLWGLAGM